MNDGLSLAFVKVQLGDGLFREPVAPEDSGEFAAALLEIKFGQRVGGGFANHYQSASAAFLDVTGQKENLGNPKVAGNGSMWVPGALGSERRQENARIPHLDAICEY
jgi:hypothetical protein